jgi:hypothetical protein
MYDIGKIMKENTWKACFLRITNGVTRRWSRWVAVLRYLLEFQLDWQLRNS